MFEEYILILIKFLFSICLLILFAVVNVRASTYGGFLREYSGKIQKVFIFEFRQNINGGKYFRIKTTSTMYII